MSVGAGCAAAYVTGPYALSRLTWAGIPILALVLASHYYCGMLMVRPASQLFHPPMG